MEHAAISTSSAEPPVADERVPINVPGQTDEMSYNSEEEDNGVAMDKPMIDLDSANYSVERDAHGLIQSQIESQNQMQARNDAVDLEVSFNVLICTVLIVSFCLG